MTVVRDKKNIAVNLFERTNQMKREGVENR